MPHLLSTSALAASLFAVLSFAVPSEISQEKDKAAHQENTAASAGELFLRNCISCHQPPDLRFETDRAWLSQVHDTA